jgi:hypothetical protein
MRDEYDLGAPVRLRITHHPSPITTFYLRFIISPGVGQLFARGSQRGKFYLQGRRGFFTGWSLFIMERP